MWLEWLVNVLVAKGAVSKVQYIFLLRRFTNPQSEMYAAIYIIRLSFPINGREQLPAWFAAVKQIAKQLGGARNAMGGTLGGVITVLLGRYKNIEL